MIRLQDCISMHKSAGYKRILRSCVADFSGKDQENMQVKLCTEGNPFGTPGQKTGGMPPSPDIYCRLLPAVHFTVLQSKVCLIKIYKQKPLGARVFFRYDRKNVKIL